MVSGSWRVENSWELFVISVFDACYAMISKMFFSRNAAFWMSFQHLSSDPRGIAQIARYKSREVGKSIKYRWKKYHTFSTLQLLRVISHVLCNSTPNRREILKARSKCYISAKKHFRKHLEISLKKHKIQDHGLFCVTL